MAVAVTVRDVPEQVRDELAARAARAGKSLQEYLRAQLVALAGRPSPEALWDRVEHRLLATGSRLSADAILGLHDADGA